jgi:site-specific DNA recombinase
LVVNEEEAEQVRSIFSLFEQHRSALGTLTEIERRGWRLKSWKRQTGDFRQGSPFDKNSLRRLLTNVLYIGSIQHKGQIYPGEHAAIVDRDSWERVQEMLTQRATFARGKARNKHHALLSGLLHCDACGTRMAYSYAAAHGRKYPYYLCLNARSKGWAVCPAKSLPAQRIEDSILAQLRINQPATASPAEWEQLERGGQIDRIQAMIKRIGYDGRTGQVSIRFHPDLLEVPITPLLIPTNTAEAAL